MMKKKQMFGTVTILLTISMIFTNVSTASNVFVYTNSPHIYIEIQTAYYTNLEDDGKKNDIFATMYIAFYSPYLINDLYLYVELELPSGKCYSYLFLLEFIIIQSTILPIEFHNHATESGNYKLLACVWFYDMTRIKASASICIFDPPGGHDDCADPPWIKLG